MWPAEVAGWTLDRKIRVRFPAYPSRVWALWWQGGKRRLRTSRWPCRGRRGTPKTPSCPWRGCPAAGQNLETGHLSRHYIAEISLNVTLNHKQQQQQQKSVLNTFGSTVVSILWIIRTLRNVVNEEITTINRALQRMRLANRGRLLLRTPGPVPFGTCICSNVETIISWTCHVYRPFEFRTSLGTSILLLNKNFGTSSMQSHAFQSYVYGHSKQV